MLMDEQQWLSCSNPHPMLDLLRMKGIANERKRRLFGVACCRRIGHLLDHRSRRAVEVAECFADGHATEAELIVAHEGAECARNEKKAHPWRSLETYQATAAWAVDFLSWPPSFPGFTTDGDYGASHACLAAAASDTLEPSNAKEALAREEVFQAALVRDMFANPFRPVDAERGWLTANVVDLARTIYEERAFERLPIVADALMDAGCTNEVILEHCRSQRPHARGCWVVDLLLRNT
jgi:hypothetical protein